MNLSYSKTQELLFELHIADVMQSNVITVTPQTTMSALRRILRDHRISGTPVVEKDVLVGIISLDDLIRWLADGRGDCRVEQYMTPRVEYLYADQTVRDAVRWMEQPRRYGRFPVLDRGTRRLVGILTKGDIIMGLLYHMGRAYEEEEVRRYRASHFFDDIVAEERLIRLTYRVVGKDFDSAGKATMKVKRNLKRLNFAPALIRRVAIASYEAEMNVVIFAEEGEMLYDISPDGIGLVVHDRGPGIEDIGQAMQPGFSTSPDWVRELGFGAGMGLNNIRDCATTFDIESEIGRGTTLRLRFNLEESQ